jgi:nitrite reductase/ring-hydroxylating ferredoxin subunit
MTNHNRTLRCEVYDRYFDSETGAWTERECSCEGEECPFPKPHPETHPTDCRCLREDSG